MAEPFPADHPYLSKGFEPIRFECDCEDLMVEGTIPEELNGSLYRVGPNPQFAPRGPYNPLLADGMIHAFHIREGRVAYRNRWVRTKQWQCERAAGRSLFGTTGSPRDADPQIAGLQTDGVANTSLVWHGQRLLALEEGHAPIQIDPVTLETIGQWTFNGALPGNMTAHPKIDPETGEMFFFANFPNRDFSGVLAFYVADADGRMTRSEMFQGPFPALVHDFAITKDYILFFICPITLSLERIRKGIAPIGWEPERGTHIGIFPRSGSASDVRWFKAPASMAWHSMNAFQRGEEISLDVCAQACPGFPDHTGKIPSDADLRQFLTRWTMDWSNPDDVATGRLDDSECEYPKIDERYLGRSYRFGFVACDGGPGTGDLFHRAVGRYDFETRQLSKFHFGTSSAVSEAVFVPKGPESNEADGHLLLTVYDERRNASYLAILDAMRIESGPVAKAHLDHRVPLGFHGAWRTATVS
jgi:carotenoid cleavage dioxygenase-like enzyme